MNEIIEPKPFSLFSDLGEKIQIVFSAGIDGISSSWAYDLINLASVCMSVYIIFYGYLILAGKVQDPIREFIWNLARYAIVIGILQNITTYERLIFDAVNGIKSFLMGGEGNTAYQALDQKFINLGVLFSDIWDRPSGLSIGSWILALFQSIATVPLILGTTISSLGFLLSELITLALLAVFPLFLFCYLWGWFKDMFAMWVQAIIGVLLFCLFLYLFSNIGYQIASYAVNTDDITGWDSLFALIIAGIVTIFGVKISEKIATALSKVSINQTLPSSQGKGKGKTK